MPQIWIRLGCSCGEITRIATVDSGAACTLCPKMFLPQLGLTEADLVPSDVRGEPSAGENFDLWRPKDLAMQGQIMLPSDNDYEPWGSMFRMELAFAECDSLLLGQRDFFGAFDVNFTQEDGIRVYELIPRTSGLRGP